MQNKNRFLSFKNLLKSTKYKTRKPVKILQQIIPFFKKNVLTLVLKID